MEHEQFVKNELAKRGFTKNTVLNNRGLIGATIEIVLKEERNRVRKELNELFNL